MARHESDRDDLFDELRTALQRWELTVPGLPTAIVAGIRPQGRFSIYFGQDPCFHYDEQNRLLRAYVAGHLYRTQGHTLARLTRSRTAHETQLLRSDLRQDELASFLQAMSANLQLLLNQLSHGECLVLRQAPPEEDSLDLLRSRLEQCLSQPQRLADAYPGRRH